MKNKRPGGIVAVFRYLDHLTAAMEKAQKRGDFDGHEVFSPTSYHEIEHTANFPPSPVRFFTLAGALTGTAIGFALPILTDMDWNIVVGGKAGALSSLPAYIIIGFELTILLGGIATILGMLVMGRIPNPKQRILDTRFTNDRFGIFVPHAAMDGAQAKILQECGAEEIKEVRAT